MKYIYIFSLLLWHMCAHAEVQTTTGVDSDANMSIIEENIKINEQEFNKVAEQIAKRYPNFDWGGYDKLTLKERRVVLKNYLARLAFDEVEENFIKDIKARATDVVEVKKEGNETLIFNKSDAKYRTNYVNRKVLLEKAKERNIWHRACEDCDTGFVKQQDVKILDEIIAQETQGLPADIYCEKHCAVFNQKQEDMNQQFLSGLKKWLQEYKEIEEKYLSEMRRLGSPRKEIKAERKRIADEIRKLEQEYDNWKKILSDMKEWRILPYTETCEFVTVGCENVEKIPDKHARFELRINNYTRTKRINYEYDDVANNTHVISTADRDCYCGHNDDLNDLKSCRCLVAFYDEIRNFTDVRKQQNQERIDIKNGKNQDLEENGRHKYHWDSSALPGGAVYGRSLDIDGSTGGTR